MDNLINLCNQFSKIAGELGVKLSLKDKNPELFEVLSQVKFISRELLAIKNIPANGKEFAYLINELIITLPLVLTYARKTISVDKPMFLDYKNLRDHVSSLLEEYIAYNNMFIDSEGNEIKLHELHVNFWKLCFELKEFLEKVTLFANEA